MALKMIAFDGANAQSLSFSRSSVVNLRLVPFRTVSFGFRTVKTPRRLRFCTSSAKRNPKRLKYSAPSITKPVASRESAVPRNEHKLANGRTSQCGEGDTIVCSYSTQEKLSRKASMVKEPIIQYVKRQKAEAP